MLSFELIPAIDERIVLFRSLVHTLIVLPLQGGQVHLRGQGSFREVVHEVFIPAAGDACDEGDHLAAASSPGGAATASYPPPSFCSGSGLDLGPAASVSELRMLRPFCFLMRGMRVEYDLTERQATTKWQMRYYMAVCRGSLDVPSFLILHSVFYSCHVLYSRYAFKENGSHQPTWNLLLSLADSKDAVQASLFGRLSRGLDYTAQKLLFPGGLLQQRKVEKVCGL